MPSENQNQYDDPAYLMKGIDALIEKKRLEKEEREKKEKKDQEEKEAAEKLVKDMELLDAAWKKLGGSTGIEKFLRDEVVLVSKQELPKEEVVLTPKQEPPKPKAEVPLVKKKVVVKRSPPRLKAVLVPTLLFLCLMGMFYSCLSMVNRYYENLPQPVVEVYAGPAIPLPAEIPLKGEDMK